MRNIDHDVHPMLVFYNAIIIVRVGKYNQYEEYHPICWYFIMELLSELESMYNRYEKVSTSNVGIL